MTGDEFVPESRVKGTALVVDDDECNRTLLYKLLTADGHTVRMACDGKEALKAAADMPDVILLDVLMPNMDGFEVCRLIKGDPQLAPIPILMITSLHDRSARLASMEAGANDFLTKPIDSQEVLLRTRNAVYQNSLYTRLKEMHGHTKALHRELNDVIGLAAHDMHSPLTVINTYSRLVLGTPEELPVPATRCLVTIHKLSTFLLRLVSDLLDISKIESGTLTLSFGPCNLLDLLQDVVCLNQILADERNITIELEAALRPPDIAIDQTKIGQVFHNLISNAIYCSPPGSTVRVHLAQKDEGIEVTVADRGPGIAPDELDRIFRPFGSARDGPAPAQQTGLGLAIANRVIRGHGGAIHVDSEPGTGVRFHVLLPYTRNPEIPQGVCSASTIDDT